MKQEGAAPLVDSILYLSSLLRVGARSIDRYIDYFGESGSASPGGPVERRASSEGLRGERVAGAPVGVQ